AQFHVLLYRICLCHARQDLNFKKSPALPFRLMPYIIIVNERSNVANYRIKAGSFLLNAVTAWKYLKRGTQYD
ncbi:MAG: hypothetical protein K2P22_05880, partial [Lachnospiraceae bacterium]|nr:hypothetical protein [Lachnospiraceae bacterium]